jgi:hypothetical protein
MGLASHLCTICEVTVRSILYEVFGPLTLAFDFSSFKNDTFECFEAVMVKAASMYFVFMVTEVGHHGD